MKQKTITGNSWSLLASGGGAHCFVAAPVPFAQREEKETVKWRRRKGKRERGKSRWSQFFIVLVCPTHFSKNEK